MERREYRKKSAGFHEKSTSHVEIAEGKATKYRWENEIGRWRTKKSVTIGGGKETSKRWAKTETKLEYTAAICAIVVCRNNWPSGVRKDLNQRASHFLRSIYVHIFFYSERFDKYMQLPDT